MWGSDNEYSERKIKEQQENDIEFWKKENERLKEIIEKQNRKLDKIENALINNYRPAKMIITEVWNIVIGRK